MVNQVTFKNTGVLDFPFKDNTVYSFTLTRGKYLFEVWGASGGNQHAGTAGQFLAEGGKGGYSKGIYYVHESRIDLFCYVGGQGSSQTTGGPAISKGGFNGGGSSLERTPYGGGSGGGGATDICTIKSEITISNERTIRTIESYRSRMIVAGGGGGAHGFIGGSTVNYRILSFGGNGGGFASQGSGYSQSLGYNPSQNLWDSYNQGGSNSMSYNYVTGSTQTSTGDVYCATEKNTAMNGAKPGSFGYGGSPTNSFSNSGGGGGGGWFGGYGGTSGENAIGTGGAGGSGYIHNSTNHNSQSSLGSQYYLKEGQLYDGSSSFPMPSNINQKETGHVGNGYARITLLSKPVSNPKISYFNSRFHYFCCMF